MMVNKAISRQATLTSDASGNWDWEPLLHQGSGFYWSGSRHGQQFTLQERTATKCGQHGTLGKTVGKKGCPRSSFVHW